jgi:hypothetical protein
VSDQLIEVGCSDCGQTCPHTNKTEPKLDRQRGEIWYALHQLICTAESGFGEK